MFTFDKYMTVRRCAGVPHKVLQVKYTHGVQWQEMVTHLYSVFGHLQQK